MHTSTRRPPSTQICVDPSPVTERPESRDGSDTLTWSRGGLNFMEVSEIPGTELGQFAESHRGRTQ